MFWVDLVQLFYFVEGFLYVNKVGIVVGGIEDCVGQGLVYLEGQFQFYCFFVFDLVGFFEGGDIKLVYFCFVSVDQGVVMMDIVIDFEDVGILQCYFVQIGFWCVFWCEILVFYVYV